MDSNAHKNSETRNISRKQHILMFPNIKVHYVINVCINYF